MGGSALTYFGSDCTASALSVQSTIARYLLLHVSKGSVDSNLRPSVSCPVTKRVTWAPVLHATLSPLALMKQRSTSWLGMSLQPVGRIGAPPLALANTLFGSTLTPGGRVERSISYGLVPLFGLKVWDAAPDQLPVRDTNARDWPPPTEHCIVAGSIIFGVGSGGPLQSRSPTNLVDSSARKTSP